jgi:hypothetical protein
MFVTDTAYNSTTNITQTQITVFELPTFTIEQRFTYINEMIEPFHLEESMDGHPSFYLRKYYFSDPVKVYKTNTALYMSDDFNLITYTCATEEFAFILTKEGHSSSENIKIAAIPVNSTSEVVVIVDALKSVSEESANLYFPMIVAAIFVQVIHYRRKQKKK